MQIRPYITVPNLIAQPTWGGDYIATHKQLDATRINHAILGQSYELYGKTHLSSKTTTSDYPSIEFGDPNNPEATTASRQGDTFIDIQSLIDQNPEKILGSIGLKRYGAKMDILIKYTQAKGNSFQLHVKQATDKWIPKPESWYYLEAGDITLGVKTTANWKEYHQTCLDIDHFVQQVSHQIMAGKVPLDQGRSQIEAYIRQQDPYRFVNSLEVSKDTAIDLSAGGIHHSWEENPAHPAGNIVYEVQQNAYDPVSTIRSFDKGKLKADGSIRPLQIEDYFTYIDRDPKANDPQSHFSPKKVVEKTKQYEVTSVFNNPLYSLEQLTLGSNAAALQITKASFHHLFVQAGSITLTVSSNPDQTFQLTQGFGMFIPGCIHDYIIKSNTSPAIIFKTFVR